MRRRGLRGLRVGNLKYAFGCPSKINHVRDAGVRLALQANLDSSNSATQASRSKSSTCNSAGCRPSRIASTISGASSVSRRNLTDVEFPDPLDLRQIVDRRVLALVQHPPPPECPLQRLHHRIVDPRPRRPLGSIRRHHQLPPAALSECQRDVNGDRSRRPPRSSSASRRCPPDCPPRPVPARRVRSVAAGPRRRASAHRPVRPAAARSALLNRGKSSSHMWGIR